MSAMDLLAELADLGIKIEAVDGRLALRAPPGTLTEALKHSLRSNRDVLIAHLTQHGSSTGLRDASRITPDMLPLVSLSQEEIDTVVAEAGDGHHCVQDIYALGPLQQGMLFHHLLDQAGDAYLMRSVIAFDSRERLDRFVAALQRVIDRHDILRTSVHWTGLSTPVQVVHRTATLGVETLALAPDEDALSQLLRRIDPRNTRLDLRVAPLLRAYIAPEADGAGWLLLLLDHHIISDNYSLQLLIGEVGALMHDEGSALDASLPYRNFIAQTSAPLDAGHERFFTDMLGDVDEPTAPFGVLDVHAQNENFNEARRTLDPALARALVLVPDAWVCPQLSCSMSPGRTSWPVAAAATMSSLVPSWPAAGELRRAPAGSWVCLSIRCPCVSGWVSAAPEPSSNKPPTHWPGYWSTNRLPFRWHNAAALSRLHCLCSPHCSTTGTRPSPPQHAAAGMRRIAGWVWSLYT